MIILLFVHLAESLGMFICWFCSCLEMFSIIPHFMKRMPHLFMLSGGVWWKKIAEKRKERCKLHSMARAGNVKEKQSLSRVYLRTGFKHIFNNVTPSAKTEKHTQIKAHVRDTKTQQV